ncbi:hypothetical protein WA556_001519 [Blastocystis sp. ATCC 50177/Nand II]
MSIGNECFQNQDVLNLTGLHSLERVMIGEKSFTKHKGSSGNDANRKLYVKNCDALKELKIGRYSFSDYSLIEIENVNSLEVIEMGDMVYLSYNFAYASLELKNLPKLKSLLFGNHAFCSSSRLVLENLPELTSIQLGWDAFLFNNVESSTLVMRNLTSLTTLTTLTTTSNSYSFLNPRHITLYDIPALTTVTLPDTSFFYKKYVSTDCNIGELKTFFTDQCKVSDCWSVTPVPLNVEVITVGNNKCNGENDRIDLSKYVNLKNVSIGNECFFYQDVLNLTGLHSLERVMIGENSFTKKKNFFGNNANRKLYVKNCDALKELKIGRYSFSDYRVIEIENVNSLELIEIGGVIEDSFNFYYASLELKNLPKLKSLLFGKSTFFFSSRLVLENLPELTSIRLGDSAFYFKNDKSSTLVMRNLPTLTSLTTTSVSWSFRYPHHITLYDIPALTAVTLPYAFYYKNDVSTNCNIGELCFSFTNQCTANECWSDTPVPLNVEVITVGNNKCNGENDRIDLSKYFNLKNVSIGNECFQNQDVLNLTGLHSLERVMIGEYSFQKSSGNNANRKLYVKNCDALKELKIGRYSFSDYSVIEIENVDKLEVLEIGSYDKNGKSFDHAPLELRNLPKLKSLLFGYGAFYYSPRLVLENLPELTSIRLGMSAFRFNADVESSTLVMRNLPTLTSLTTFRLGSYSFYYPRHITLYDIPALTAVTLPNAFFFKNDVSTNCNIGELYSLLSNICTVSECWGAVPLNVKVITIGNHWCNGENERIDLSKYFNLKNVSIGNECFFYQDVLNLTGLHSLERVMIGEKSFTKKKNYYGNNANRKLYVKNCDALKELKIGRYSFSDYSVIEIENVNSLELIEIGGVIEDSFNFYSASLELKNLPKLKSLLFGKSAFRDSSRLVLENLPELTSIRLGDSAFYFNNDKSSTLIMRNLPKLTSLTTSGSYSFRYPHHITLYVWRQGPKKRPARPFKYGW